MALVSKEFKGTEDNFKEQYSNFKAELIKRNVIIKDRTIMLQKLYNGTFINITYENYDSMRKMLYRSTKYRLIHNTKY